MQLILLIGIQAVGKSTFCFERFQHTHLRLNLDMLRTRHRERILFEACLASKTPCVIDNTNSTAAERATYIAPALAAKFSVTGFFFESRIADALARNRERTGKAKIPDAGVLSVHQKLEIPKLNEGFEALQFVRIGKNGFEVEEWRNEI